MPRTIRQRRKVRRREAQEALQIGHDTFWRHWHGVFTDPRSEADQRAGVERKVYEDELQVALDADGHPSGRIAVLNYRAKLNRV